MRAITHARYGSPDDLELREIERPRVADDGVLVRVRASSVNPADWHLIRGEPYLVRLSAGRRKPKRSVPGIDVAGRVEEVGAHVTELRPGDEVLGGCGGAFAEYVAGTERDFLLKPARLTFEQAAAVPVAGCTALQALRDHGHLQPGQRVLINGAAGGVGTFAVQIARYLGGHVTAVCSARNVDPLGSIGADAVIDYAAEDFTRTGQRYDLVLNIAGNHSLSDLRRALTPTGTLVLVGTGSGREASSGGLVQPLLQPLTAIVLSRIVRQRLRPFIAAVRRDDLAYLGQLIEAGAVTPVIDRSYPLSEISNAFRYLEAGHAHGKVVITVS
jgi:NADPH:quinone reductase-like Zn-dependent oxidoreductase